MIASKNNEVCSIHSLTLLLATDGSRYADEIRGTNYDLIIIVIIIIIIIIILLLYALLSDALCCFIYGQFLTVYTRGGEGRGTVGVRSTRTD